MELALSMRREMIIRQPDAGQEKWAVAVHESGHAICALDLGLRVEKLTIKKDLRFRGACFLASPPRHQLASRKMLVSGFAAELALRWPLRNMEFDPELMRAAGNVASIFSSGRNDFQHQGALDIGREWTSSTLAELREIYSNPPHFYAIRDLALLLEEKHELEGELLEEALDSAKAKIKPTCS